MWRRASARVAHRCDDGRFDTRIPSPRPRTSSEMSEPTWNEGDSGEHRDRMEATGRTVNGDSDQVWRYDQTSANRSFSGRMEFW